MRAWIAANTTSTKSGCATAPCPRSNLADVDTATTFLGKRLSFPLLISCMTGGDHTLVRRINRNLAEAAEACGVAMGVGSQRVMFKSPKARASFALRPLRAHRGAAGQPGRGAAQPRLRVSECRAAVDVLQADALVLHLNPLQEAVQPEGDTELRRPGRKNRRGGARPAPAGHPEGSGSRAFPGGRRAAAPRRAHLRRGRQRRHLVEPHRAPSPERRPPPRSGPAVPGLGPAHPTGAVGTARSPPSGLP
jgi:hypothetical protein